MARAQVNDAAGEREQVPLPVLEPPLDPGQLVVLAVDVVVAALAPAQLVAVSDHRDALRKQQGGEEVSLLACPHVEHRAIGRVPLDATVPGAVVALAVRTRPRRWRRCASRCTRRDRAW